MFEELRGAWREAVDNFYRELRGGVGDDARLGAMRREHAAAAAACRRVEQERDRARQELEQGRAELVTYRRRREMAERIGDAETAEVASRFVLRYEERARVLERVVSALDAEISLRRRDVEEMRVALSEVEAAAERVAQGGGAAGVADGSVFAQADERTFQHMEQRERERQANEHLEELKRKMR